MTETEPKIPKPTQPTTAQPTTTSIDLSQPWRTTDITRLHQWVGNRQLQRMLRPQQPRVSLMPTITPIQRDFAVQVDLDISDQINEIVLSGTRPKGALAQKNKEGSHTTAWIVTVEGVKNAVMGKTAKDAVAAMDVLFDTAKDLPGTKRLGSLVGYKKDEYNSALDGANKAQTKAQKDKDVNSLQLYIRAYLTYRNIIPLSAVDSGGSADGRGEAHVVELIRNYEDYDSDIILGAMLALFDAPAISSASESNSGASLGDRSANTPGMKKDESAKSFNLDVMKQHLMSLKVAFPEAFVYAFGDVEVKDINLGKIFNRALSTKAKDVLSQAGQDVEEEMLDDTPETPTNEDEEVEESSGTGKHTSSMQVVLGDDGKVTDVFFGSRPHGLFGSKHGSHTTAWGVFTAGVLNAVKGKTIAEAAAGMKGLSDVALTLPGVARAKYLPEPRQVAFADAKKTLEETDSDAINTQSALQNYIRDYLTFRNLVPLSAAMLGRAPGKGEAEALDKLRASGLYTKEELQAAIFKLMDKEAMIEIGKGSQKLPEKTNTVRFDGKRQQTYSKFEVEQHLTAYAEKKGYIPSRSLRRRATFKSTNVKSKKEKQAPDPIKEGLKKARASITADVEFYDKQIMLEKNEDKKQQLLDTRNELINKYLMNWYSPESDDATHQRLPGTEGWSETEQEKIGGTTTEKSAKSAQRMTEVLKQHFMTIKASFPTAYDKAAIDKNVVKGALNTLKPIAIFGDSHLILIKLIEAITTSDDMLGKCLPT